jgi:hypothetical protein
MVVFVWRHKKNSIMFILELYDRKGTKLNLGDIVKISDGRHFQFYCEVKYLEKECCITPFHTFSFISVEKVNKLPDDVVLSSEERYRIWYHPEKEEDDEVFENYLMSWRECEHELQHKCWRIKLIK